MNVGDPKVGEHSGCTIQLETSTGRFYTSVNGKSDLSDKTLDGLKKRIDNAMRLSSREKAISLPCVAFAFNRYDDDGGTWYKGTFAGINAHTGDVSMLVNGKPLVIGTSYFMRADDPAVESVAEAIKAEQAAKRAYDAAKERRTAMLRAHTMRAEVSSYGRNKTEEAARSEERLIAFLENRPANPT